MRATTRIAFLLSLVLQSSASAKTPPTDVTNGKIQCYTVLGVVAFKPPLASPATASSMKIKVKGSLAGCIVTDVDVGGVSPVSVPTGTFSGTLIAGSNSCDAFIANESLTGTLTFKWKADSETPITPKSSTVTIASITATGGPPQGFFVAPWGAEHLQLSLGATSGSGAFAGTDFGGMFGRNLSNDAITSENIGAVFNGCASAKGLKLLHIGLGRLRFS
jgi:hypothetical protein